MLLFFPLIYFICVAFYFFKKHGSWNLDVAATMILVVISLCALMIDFNDLYGDYGINLNAITLPTIILFCLQWTFVLIPIHLISSLTLYKHDEYKTWILYTILIVVSLNSFVMVYLSIEDIRDALIMDMADVRNAHYTDMQGSSGGERNMLRLLPTIVTSGAFPTFALFFWFYVKANLKTSFISIFLQIVLMLSSIVQATISITIAGRAALVYWIFDFYLIYSFFYKYLSKKLKRGINISALVVIVAIIGLFISITVSRFEDESNNAQINAFDSLYGYAGQHINNFCSIMQYGADSPLQTARIFPLLSKFMGIKFSLVDHYDNIVKYVQSEVNVFDTFGAEVYLDFGWFGYILFFILWGLMIFYIYKKWESLDFYKSFYIVIFIAFFSRGVFAWPFTNHYSTFATMLLLCFAILFKYRFKLK